MWISDDYYKELLGVIKQFAKGNFDFEEDRLEQFNHIKYKDITNLLIEVKKNSRRQIYNIAKMLQLFADGNYETIDGGNAELGDYQEIYHAHNRAVRHLDRINRHIERLKEAVTEKGKIDSRLDTDELEGKWFDSISNINTILESLATPVDEIRAVINNVAKGDLTQKMRLKIDDFKISGDFLNLAITINTMVDQLSLFASEVTRVAREVGTDGLLGGRAKVEGVSGIWLDLTNNVNRMADSLTVQVRNIADVTTAVAQGDLTQKITVDARGEILELKRTINRMVDQLSLFASEVTRVAREVGTDGLLGGRAKVEGVSGIWLDLTNNVNGMADSLTVQVRNIADVTTAVAKGDLTQKITVDARGEILELKGTINRMVDQLSLFASEVTRVAREVGTDGLLGGRAKVEGVSGTWLDLTNNVNGMADSLTVQVRNIADVTTAVAKGDLTQKITVDARGEILELKGTINRMVDQLSLFASEVTRVAREVGTDGLLGGRAKVEGVSGTWLDLTNNVNGMADSLTVQVRNIADVTTAVAKGDLTQKITVDARGEILELKGTINRMVDRLSLFASEVTRVAREVGTDGLLGGRAKVDDVSGTWLDLTNNVNGMADSLTAQVRNIIEVAMAVASGDLTRKIMIDVKGEFLELKNNINTMINVLAEEDTKNRNQNWIKDGVSILNKKILNKDTLAEQTEIAINQLSRYINAGVGTLYLYDSDTKSLKLEAAYAHVKSNNLPNEFKLGEGVVGQVAYEKRPIMLTNVTNSLSIDTGTTASKTVNTYTSPLVFKDKLIGVVEIASCEMLDRLKLEYFDSALDVLSGSLYALQANATSSLLIQSQRQSKDLEKQSIKLKLQNEELEKQRLAIDKQKKDLEDANRYKSEFLANMSHELRTPLNSILLLSNSLARTGKIDIEKINKQASIIHDAGKGLLDLINDVLDLSKIEAKLMTLNIEKIHFGSLSDDLYQLFAPQAEKKGITLKTNLHENTVEYLISDKVKLTQILKNFISNAIKFTGPDGLVELTFGKNREEDGDIRPIKISVADNGIGIEEEKIDLIFEAFRQADGGTSRKYGGTGLGLSISKEFAELLGGRIFVESELGMGSLFGLCLPKKIDTKEMDSELIEHVHKEKAAVRSNAENAAAPHEGQTQPNDSPRENIKTASRQTRNRISTKKDQISDNDTVILVVEDDKTFSDIIVEQVHKLGYKAIAAYDGNSAVLLAREYQPRAVLLDLVLPALDGIEVLRILKADLMTRHIPVKVFSCSGDANTVTKRMGAIDFIKKPLSIDIIGNIISSLVDFANHRNKQILLIEGEGNDSLAHLLSDHTINVAIAESAESGINLLLKREKFDCVVVNATSGIDLLGFLEVAVQKGITCPVIVYNENDFSHRELADFRKYYAGMVLKTASSYTKLVEEVSLFLHSIKDSLNTQKQELLTDAMTSDELLHSEKILIVDDDIRNVYALSSILEVKNMEIIYAQNGQEALELLNDEKNKFDMVLMDIMMPVMNGYEAIQEIRKMEKFKNLPIIALTAKARKEDKQKCMDAGANDYMAKPIDQEKLLMLLKIWAKKIILS